MADFRLEIERLRPADTAAFQAVSPPEDDHARATAKAGRTDLENALASSPLAAEKRAALQQAYEALRAELLSYATAVRQWEEKRRWAGDDSIAPRPQPPQVVVPAGLPDEFARYLEGAIAHYRERPDAARAAWQSVLTLPPDRRRYRSTWAAFMLGKSWLRDDRAAAVRYFRQVRSLVRQGFHDSLGLAASSLGWEARAERARGRFEQATDLYLKQLATGDPTALPSLRIVVRDLLKGDADTLRRAARHEPTRRVVTAYLIAGGGPYGRGGRPEDAVVPLAVAWLQAIEAAALVEDVAGAERLGWLAYRAGDMPAAERWLARADADLPITHWLRAKLLLRAGEVDEAMPHLAAAAQGFPQDEHWQWCDDWCMPENGPCAVRPAGRALAELGVLHLARREYVASLDALLRARFWMDAAHVAERVLTLDELAAYVVAHWPACDATEDERPGGCYYPSVPQSDDGVAVRIRHLLARRLARAGRYADAQPYFPRRCQPAFAALVKHLTAGKSPRQPPAARAADLWQAARIARYDGLTLFGAELDPDWFAFDGNFERYPVWLKRTQPDGGRLNRGSADEYARARQHTVQPPLRWHFRYVAAELAWEAAALMPDESDETARVLCEAGSWLKARNPERADRYYKALVRRCGTTSLGREADRLRWFPSLTAHAEPENVTPEGE
jgi:tetratricopeptide (TPR) repeat protein